MMRMVHGADLVVSEAAYRVAASIPLEATIDNRLHRRMEAARRLATDSTHLQILVGPVVRGPETTPIAVTAGCRVDAVVASLWDAEPDLAFLVNAYAVAAVESIRNEAASLIGKRYGVERPRLVGPGLVDWDPASNQALSELLEQSLVPITRDAAGLIRPVRSWIGAVAPGPPLPDDDSNLPPTLVGKWEEARPGEGQRRMFTYTGISCSGREFSMTYIADVDETGKITKSWRQLPEGERGFVQTCAARAGLVKPFAFNDAVTGQHLDGRPETSRSRPQAKRTCLCTAACRQHVWATALATMQQPFTEELGR